VGGVNVITVVKVIDIGVLLKVVRAAGAELLGVDGVEQSIRAAHVDILPAWIRFVKTAFLKFFLFRLNMVKTNKFQL
jgi:hypothetical protein